MKYPTELQLLEFFGVEPVIHDDVTAYTVFDDSDLALTLSFNTADDSLQTSLQIGERVIAVVSQEGMTRFWISDGVLMCEFVHEDVRFNVAVSTHPNIHIEWSGIRTN